MNVHGRMGDGREPRAEGSRDSGASLIEILIAVVLLGTVVVSVLGALQVSVIGTRTERDHARAHQWLQSASSVLQGTDRVSCEDNDTLTGHERMLSGYLGVLRNVDEVASPTEWRDDQIEIVEPIRVWDGQDYWDARVGDPSGRRCFQPLYQLQLITIQVRSPDGRIIETREVVKGG